jgi:hypothetical protein
METKTWNERLAEHGKRVREAKEVLIEASAAAQGVDDAFAKVSEARNLATIALRKAQARLNQAEADLLTVGHEPIRRDTLLTGMPSGEEPRARAYRDEAECVKERR